MEGFYSTAPDYPDCKHIHRTPIDVHVSNELATKLAEENANVLPLYERKIHDYKCMKHSSMETNELLRCRWKGFLKILEGRHREPFKFPHLSDYHYSNYAVRFNPKETISNRADSRLHMKGGPGVDVYGQIPIPHNESLRRPKHGES